ncbi:MAG: hypothetical protein HY092_03830 [Candidatus Kerfeldbacteria bacterium]|nr:hypothetical protein [Candidatus Kerfeldbacteria bacterium]
MIRFRFVMASFLVAVAVFFVRPARASAATMYFSPSSGSYAVGQTISVSVKVNTEGQAINAAEGTVVFPNNLLQFKDVSKSGSIFSFWTVEPAGSTGSGRVTFSGGVPNPGFRGSSGTVIRITFAVKTTGQADLNLTGARVLANDGQGTDILSGQGGASYLLTAATAAPTNTTKTTTPSLPLPVITSPEFPDQTKWYKGSAVTFQWNSTGAVSASSFGVHALAVNPNTVLGASYAFDQTSSTVPDEVPEPNTGSVTEKIPADGVWYFHIRFLYSGGWSKTASYRIQRDTTPPEPFTITLAYEAGGSSFDPIVQVDAVDKTSGIAHTELVLDQEPAYSVTTPYKLHLTKAGSHHISITLADQAGNSQSSELSFDVHGYPSPTITSVTSPIILLDTLVVHGTAQPGDTVSLYLSGTYLGQVTLGGKASGGESSGAQGVTVSAPWVFVSDQVTRPGTYRLTATATSSDNQVSGASQSKTVRITGTLILLGGHPIATFAAIPLALVTVATLLVAIFGVLVRMFLALRHLHARSTQADQAIRKLRFRILKTRMSDDQIETSLEKIEEDLGKKPPPIV